MSQPAKNDFKWRRYQGQLILLSVRWYLTYTLSYRQLERMLREQGWAVHHTSIFRWVQRYSPELARRCQAFLKSTNRSYRVDETYIKVKGKDRYLYRAVDSTGQTIDFLLTAKRDKAAAKRFFRQALSGSRNSSPRVINVDKNAAYPPAVKELKAEGLLSRRCRLRQCKFLNNIVEIVFTQMTKTSGFAAGMSRDHIADLHFVVGHQDSINEEFHQSPLLCKAGVG